MPKLRLAVFFGGRSGEHEISLMSARSVLGALDRGKYEVYQVGITHAGSWLSGEDVLGGFEREDFEGLQPVTILPGPGGPGLYARGKSGVLEEITPLDLAFPVLHGSFGEDGTIQGLFEMAELPYVGAGVLASAVAMDKALLKDVMQSRGIPVLEWLVLNTTELETDLDRALERAESVAGYPLFIKPANLGSSVGISKVRSRSDLMEGLMEAAQYDRRVLVERGIEAREIEVSVLGNEEPEASVPGEIVPSDEFYSYRAKYLDNRSELHIPAPIDAETTEEARRISIEAYQAIDGAGMARVDLLLDKATGRLYLNELNTIPGFTRISMYPKLLEASGISYPELMDRLIELAQARHAQKQKLVRSYEGAA
ncbi:MAG: D-alanine--D-alanine ligase family protein [Chloroflexota bacterium]